MKITTQIAKHIREVHFGGNWTSVNLKEVLKDVTWQQATTKVYSFNTIAALVYHIHYYIAAVLKVLQGNALEAKDAYSFNHPPILSQQDWEQLLDKIWEDAASFACQIEELPDATLENDFTDDKYGSYYRNLQGITEHTHYHLGQIVLIKKLLSENITSAQQE